MAGSDIEAEIECRHEPDRWPDLQRSGRGQPSWQRVRRVHVSSLKAVSCGVRCWPLLAAVGRCWPLLAAGRHSTARKLRHRGDVEGAGQFALNEATSRYRPARDSNSPNRLTSHPPSGGVAGGMVDAFALAWRANVRCGFHGSVSGAMAKGAVALSSRACRSRSSREGSARSTATPCTQTSGARSSMCPAANGTAAAADLNPSIAPGAISPRKHRVMWKLSAGTGRAAGPKSQVSRQLATDSRLGRSGTKAKKRRAMAASMNGASIRIPIRRGPTILALPTRCSPSTMRARRRQAVVASSRLVRSGIPDADEFDLDLAVSNMAVVHTAADE